MSLPEHLRRIDGRSPPGGGLLAVMAVRNEIVRIASNLAHHRALGVEQFLVVDNGSSDGTLEFLEAQPDVRLWATEESYAGGVFSVTWRNALLDAYANDAWALCLDADELFIYPRFETARLPALCRYLDAAGSRAVFAIMLDMYANRPLTETLHPRSGSLVETCPYFDAGPYHAIAFPEFPNTRVFGGVRERLITSRLGGRYHLPVISKIPLVKWGDGVAYTGAHHMTAVPLAEVTGALLHFKFLADFHANAEEEVERGEHYGGAIEYRAYRELMREGLTTLMADVSVRFADSAQLVAMNLMRTSQAWQAAV